MPTRETLPTQELWKTRAVKAAQAAKRGALAAVKQADALIKVARQKAVAALATVASEIRSRSNGRTSRSRKRSRTGR